MQEIRHWVFYVKGEGSFGIVVILRFLEIRNHSYQKREGRNHANNSSDRGHLTFKCVFREVPRGGALFTPQSSPLYVTYRRRWVLVSRTDCGTRMTNSLSRVPFRITQATATRAPGHRCQTNGYRCAGPAREEPRLREALGTHHTTLSSNNIITHNHSLHFVCSTSNVSPSCRLFRDTLKPHGESRESAQRFRLLSQDRRIHA